MENSLSSCPDLAAALDDLDDFNPFYDAGEEDKENEDDGNLFDDDAYKPWFDSPKKTATCHSEEEELNGFEFHQAVARLDDHVNAMELETASSPGLMQRVRGVFAHFFHKRLSRDEDDIISSAWEKLALEIRRANAPKDLPRNVMSVICALGEICTFVREPSKLLGASEQAVGELLVETWNRWFLTSGEEEAGGRELCNGLLELAVVGLGLKPYLTSNFQVPPTMLHAMMLNADAATTPVNGQRRRKRMRETV